MHLTLVSNPNPYTIEQIENMIEQEKQVVIFTCYEEVVKQITEKYPEAGTITGNDSTVQDKNS